MAGDLIPGKMVRGDSFPVTKLAFDPFAFVVVESSSASVNASTQEAIALDTTPNPITVNLPAGAAGIDGRVIRVKLRLRPGSNDVTITPNGSDTINGLGSLVLNTQGQFVTLIYFHGSTRWETW